ncbi:MAG TPA: TCP-1/cpn60 chaperonin family protein [Candidatus Thermoplasmatota archaeon]|nr:TCP-1/cpn60 chaperonin family protein [Candidatus Thermoplasmatota archaeon]
MAAREDDSPLLAARWLEECLSGSLGPNGGTTLVQQGDGSVRCVRGAAALREAGTLHHDVQPYLQLAHTLHEQAGDGSTTAVLLAARLVRQALEAVQAGLPAAASLDGYALAQRQALASVRALRTQDGGRSLATVAPHVAWTPLVLDGLRGLTRQGVLDLDAIDVRAEGDAATWLDGLVATPQWAPTCPPAGKGIALVAEEWKPRPLHDVTLRIQRADGLGGPGAAEDRLRETAAAHVTALGVGLLVCARGLDEGLCARLASAGTLVWTDAPRHALRRLERCTGARLAPRVHRLATSDVGVASSLARRPARQGGWLVRGAGPSATLAVPAATRAAQDSARDDAERLLRAAGLWLREPGAVPGGGRWQRAVAQALRSAADAAPGKAALAVRAAAAAVASLADDLVRNAGGDPLAGGTAPGAQDAWDGAATVHLTVGSAFATARAILRVDARHAKRPSSQVGLRGGAGKVGSPRGLPGDIPPLM